MAARNKASGKRATGVHQPIATVVGVVFLLVGIAGFIPGITTNYDMLEFAGHESGAELLGIFEVSVLHNVVHLLFGVAGLALARSESTAVAYLLGGGLIYLLLFVYGLIVDMDSAANFVPVNDADNWLHLALGIGMLALGFVPGRSRSRSDTNRTTTAPGGRDRPVDADRDPKQVGRAHGDSGTPGREDLSDRQRRQGRGRS